MNKNFLLIILVFVFLTGCAAQKKNIVTGSEPASMKQLDFNEAIDIINNQTQKADIIKADIHIEMKSSLIDGTKFCNGKMVLSRDGRIRIKGYQPFVPTLFDLASNGERFWLYVPQEKKLYTGVYHHDADVKDLKLDVDPFSIVSAMTFEGVDLSSGRQMVFLEKYSDSCVVNVLNVSTAESGAERFFLRRKIFIGLETRKIARQQYFDDDAEMIFEVFYDKYSNISGVVTPQEIVFIRPQTKSKVSISILKQTFAKECNPEIFSLDNVKDVKRIEMDR